MRKMKTITCIELAIAYINANPDASIDLNGLAKMSGMSRFHFAREFRAATGITPMKCRAIARVDCARAKLAAMVSIAIAAIACGFASQSHMTRVFRQRTGETPGQYQRRVVTQQESPATEPQAQDHPLARPE